ncbi:carbohydrate-binding protein [Streptomyces sp. CWNU-52B]|uniref:carbohydrate-binding protein n=1 Tax=unclassified Streptomyces TaxID=2593676 RepID=UPI0039BF5603
MAHRHTGRATRTNRTTRTTLGVLGAFGALVLTGLPATAAAAGSRAPAEPPAPTSAQTLGADKPSSALVRALVRDLGLTGAQARERLVNEAEAGTRAGRLQNELGKHFAGAWVHGTTSGGLTVATTDAAGVSAIKAGGAQARIVQNALRDLRAAKTKLDAAAVGEALDTPVRYVDVRTNRVTVQATSRGAADKLIAAAGVDRRLVDVKVSADRPRVLHDVRGGDAYYIDDNARCSVGFSVTKGEQQGFVSAGHCGEAGARTSGFNRVDQGVFEASVFPGQDMSWVGVNSQWTATPTVKGEGDADVQVAGSVQALVGAAICRSGSTTGWHCGTIEQHDTTVSYSEGDVNGVTRTTVCAEPGDSGGSYISGTQAQGVTSGGSGDCKSGGITFHQPINPVLSAYGLTLSTATDQSGTPAPEDGRAATWTSGQVYEVGTRVTHDGVSYQCLQAHQAQGAWQPGLTPALWQRL